MAAKQTVKSGKIFAHIYALKRLLFNNALNAKLRVCN